MQTPLVPDPEAMQMAEAMVGPDAEEVHRNIISETLEAAESGQVLESGRTACGNVENVHPAIGRFPTAVDLPGCPVGNKVGIWHTHVTPDELRNPKHSLPDYANVVYGLVDASVVVGAETSHVLVRAEDGDEMREAFEGALGISVDGPRGVAKAIENDDVDYPRARREVEHQFVHLQDTTDTAYPEFEQHISEIDREDIAIPAAHIQGCTTHSRPDKPEAEEVEPQHRPAPVVGRPRGCTCLRERAGRAGYRAAQMTPDGISIREIAAGQIIGVVVGRVAEEVIFGG